jgi:hypothetical protein
MFVNKITVCMVNLISLVLYEELIIGDSIVHWISWSCFFCLTTVKLWVMDGTVSQARLRVRIITVHPELQPSVFPPSLTYFYNLEVVIPPSLSAGITYLCACIKSHIHSVFQLQSGCIGHRGTWANYAFLCPEGRWCILNCVWFVYFKFLLDLTLSPPPESHFISKLVWPVCLNLPIDFWCCNLLFFYVHFSRLVPSHCKYCINFNCSRNSRL